MTINLLPSISIQFLGRLLRELDVPPFEVRFPNQRVVSSRPGVAPKFRVVLRDDEALTKVFSKTDFKSLGECYLQGDFDLEGDLEAIFPVAEQLGRRFPTIEDRDEPTVAMGYRPSEEAALHARERDRDSVQYHYDLSNRVYRLITGPSLSYSSAYYESPADDIDRAQERKFERVCAKLRIEDGHNLLDVGCGWGTMMRHAAKRNNVTITGVTVSTQQAIGAKDVLVESGVKGARVITQDYRDIDESAPYDRIFSLGMVEHVGEVNLQLYFEKMFRLLKPGGLFLCQGVASYPCETDIRANAFAQTYQFPDAEMPYLTKYVEAAQAAGFDVRDIENMREHYALTHRAWGRNLKASRETIVDEIGEERYRALELLYAYSPYYFLKRHCGVFQFVLYRPAGLEILHPMGRFA